MPRVKGRAKEPSTERMAATAVETESKPTSSLMKATIRMYPFQLALASLATSELVKSKLVPSRRTTLEWWEVMRKPMRLSTECFAESKMCVLELKSFVIRTVSPSGSPMQVGHTAWIARLRLWKSASKSRRLQTPIVW